MPEERKLVSVVFADVVGSTAWGAQQDPEFIRRSMARYFARMKGVAEAHGGTLTLQNRRGQKGCEARLRLPL